MFGAKNIILLPLYKKVFNRDMGEKKTLKQAWKNAIYDTSILINIYVGVFCDVQWRLLKVLFC